MRLLFAGTPAAAVPALDAFAASEHEIAAVLTRPDRRSGRGRSVSRSDVGQRADELGLTLLQPNSVRDPDFQDTLRRLDLDIAAIVAYGGLIPADALTIPRHGWINLHFSLLPRWRGAAPVQHAIAAGDSETGISTFQLEAGLDTGPVYAQESVRIGPADTTGALLERLAYSGADVLRQTVDEIAAGTAIARPQPTDGITLAPKIEVADVQIDPEGRTSMELDRLIRSASPAPGAWLLIDGDRVKVGSVEVTDEFVRPGTLEVRKREVLLGTADFAIRLGQVQVPGKRPMAAADAARGARWTTDTPVGAR